MEERWMGAQDSLDEKGVACVDGASQADGGFDPQRSVSIDQRSHLGRPTWWASFHVERRRTGSPRAKRRC